jgi:predicted metal-binding membrane protein
MEFDQAVERLLKRDRLVVLAGLVIIALLAWLFTANFALQMNTPPAATSDINTSHASGMDMTSNMSNMNMGDSASDMTMDTSLRELTQLRVWSGTEALLMFSMWAVMMVAMMIPSATPVILLYARVVRQRINIGQPFPPTGAFFLGYVTVWIGFSALATGLQWGLEQLALLTPMLVANSAWLGGGILIIAGVYQWLPSKQVCLRHCRSPIEFLSRHWQHGTSGAFKMGLRHGVYCLGCCWALMLLLFAGGVMNLLWLAAIAIFVLLEKVAPFGQYIGRAGAVLLIAGGVGSIIESIMSVA